MSRRIALETWDPAYGAAADGFALEPSDVGIDPSIECTPTEWAPISPPEEGPKTSNVLFIDGVRRIDAFAWITEDNGPPFRAIFASIGAGAVRTGSTARVVAAEVRRVLVAAKTTAAIDTRAGRWAAQTSTVDSAEGMSATVQERLTDLEIEVARVHGGGAELVVIDGPLRGRQDISGAVGYVKTHQVAYLPSDLQSVVAALRAGQRTPLFRCTTSWSRYSWYLRLPGNVGHAWWGVVRLEASEHLALEKAVALANATALVLPRFASTVHKDPRAPQNLFPIGALESELRRRLGDREILERSIRIENSRNPSVPGQRDHR